MPLGLVRLPLLVRFGHLGAPLCALRPRGEGAGREPKKREAVATRRDSPMRATLMAMMASIPSS